MDKGFTKTTHRIKQNLGMSQGTKIPILQTSIQMELKAFKQKLQTKLD